MTDQFLLFQVQTKVDYWNSTMLNDWMKIYPKNSAEKITLQKTQLKLKEN